jgi:hypothetical protein
MPVKLTPWESEVVVASLQLTSRDPEFKVKGFHILPSEAVTIIKKLAAAGVLQGVTEQEPQK